MDSPRSSSTSTRSPQSPCPPGPPGFVRSGCTTGAGVTSTSPAIDFGLNAESTPADQRGVARPVDGDGNGTLRVDAGAVEAPAVAMAPPPARPGPMQPSTPAQPVRVQPTYTG